MYPFATNCFTTRSTMHVQPCTFSHARLAMHVQESHVQESHVRESHVRIGARTSRSAPHAGTSRSGRTTISAQTNSNPESIYVSPLAKILANPSVDSRFTIHDL